MQGNQCPTCQHYLGEMNCEAFPAEDSIPPEYATGEKRHGRPRPGQVGHFVYEEGEPKFLREEAP